MTYRDTTDAIRALLEAADRVDQQFFTMARDTVLTNLRQQAAMVRAEFEGIPMGDPLAPVICHVSRCVMAEGRYDFILYGPARGRLYTRLSRAELEQAGEAIFQALTRESGQ